MRFQSFSYKHVLSTLALIASFLVILYLPGLSGPYTLDDNSNLLSNKQLQITELSAESINNAAFSVQSGPTSRPISMVSFAINYYFVGSFNDSRPYKTTNLVIHIINSGLVFWFLYLLICQSLARSVAKEQAANINRSAFLFSAIIALLWAIHPIQLTSILYVVQRMSALAGTFVLLALISYMVGRKRINVGERSGFVFIFVFAPLLAFIGIFAKENAALVPLYVAAIEATLYQHDKPWKYWNSLRKQTKYLILSASGIILVAIILWFIAYSLPGYNSRPFSIVERLLTEGRVISFYISLILVPRLNSFGLHHDDIAVSQNLLTPWTTLPSLLFLATIIFFAIYFRKKYPLISVGIFIFFAAHVLESTIYPLDIAYEHRNYFASLGLLLATVEAIKVVGHKINTRMLIAAAIGFVLLTATTTYIRATQWKSDKSLYAFEALHHPNSAILNFELAGFLEAYGKHDQAVAAARKSISLDPDRVSFRIFLALLLARNNQSSDNANSESITILMQNGKVTPVTYLLLRKVVNCVKNECSSLLSDSERWLTALVNSKSVNRPYVYNHMLGAVKFTMGKPEEAEVNLLESININPDYSAAYIDLATVYLKLNKPKEAVDIYIKLINADPGKAEEYRKRISILSTKTQY